MVENMATRIGLSHSVENGWKLGHLDVKSAFLNEEYRCSEPVYLPEIARADDSYLHGITVGVLRLNFYAYPSATYYYIEGLLRYLHKIRAQPNGAE